MVHAESKFDPNKADGTNETINGAISVDGTPQPGQRYILPARQGVAVKVATGQKISIFNVHGSQVCDFWAFAAHDLHEYLSMPHQRAVTSSVFPKKGDTLVSNKRRPLLKFYEDTSSSNHDTQIAACDVYRYRQLGVQGYHDNCTDNLRMAVQAIGLILPEVPAPLNLWMNIPILEEGVVDWAPPLSRAGDFVIFEAQMDVILVMSACPQDLVPINGLDNIPRELAYSVALER